MAFPPAFDRAWDETFPPDTQAANLLGQDIRNFKTDIRERLALLSGTLANRPTNMDAAFGGSGYGILYFATDTKQTFQWTGSAWTDVSVSIFPFLSFSNTTLSVVDNPNTNLSSITIPAGTLLVGSLVTVFCRVKQNIGPSVQAASIAFGATTIGVVNLGVGVIGTIHSDVIVLTSVSQRGIAFGIATGGVSNINYVDPAENIANAILVTLNVTGVGTYEVQSDLLVVVVKR